MVIRGYPSEPDSQRWFRGWFFLPSGRSTSIEPLILQSAGGEPQISFYSEGPSFSELHTHGVSMPEESASAAGRFSYDQWICVELHVDHTGAPTFELFLDSTLAAQISAPSPDTMREALVGLAYADPDLPPISIYVDDVVLSSERVGCAP